jgi:diketogulonate reductase-like aldo/keto reductase
MSLSGGYNSPLSDEDGISVIKYAFNKGITFFDTSDAYGPHSNEILLGKVHIIDFLHLLAQEVGFFIVVYKGGR